MPKKLHAALRRQSSPKRRKRKGLKPVRDRDAYVYGTLAKVKKRKRS